MGRKRPGAEGEKGLRPGSGHISPATLDLMHRNRRVPHERGQARPAGLTHALPGSVPVARSPSEAYTAHRSPTHCAARSLADPPGTRRRTRGAARMRGGAGERRGASRRPWWPLHGRMRERGSGRGRGNHWPWQIARGEAERERVTRQQQGGGGGRRSRRREWGGARSLTPQRH